MTTKERHSIILEEFYKKYQKLETDKYEYTWDGPSDWENWEKTTPKILFLVKEARKGFHPSVSSQSSDNKLAKNLFRWTIAINTAINQSKLSNFPDDNLIPPTMDGLCIVEIKKLNEEKPTSNNNEILEYAKRDRYLLQQQIDILAPNIVVCCGDINWYDAIYENNYQVEEKLVIIDNKSCWLVNDRLVLDFSHPSTWPNWVDPNEKDVSLFETLGQLMTNSIVQENIFRIKQ